MIIRTNHCCQPLSRLAAGLPGAATGTCWKWLRILPAEIFLADWRDAKPAGKEVDKDRGYE
jgi:hypothetical protein